MFSACYKDLAEFNLSDQANLQELIELNSTEFKTGLDVFNLIDHDEAENLMLQTSFRSK